MRQYRTYGDPSWFRSIHRGMPDDMLVSKSKGAPVSAPDSKADGAPRPPAKKGAHRRTGIGRTLAERRAAEGWGSAETAADAWVKEGAVRKNENVKMLGTGDISVALNVSVDKVSGSAEQKIVAAGGTVN